jgi:alpha-methylacyl-CoA racemase
MSGALDRVRVLVLGGVGPVPFAAMMFADHGADVVMVDRPGAATVADRVHNPDGPEILGRGCARIALDLKDPDDRATARDLAATADVVVEGFRPGVAERLGVGPDDCVAGNPRLVYARMTGWGQDGPAAARAGHDITYLAATGALHAIGRAGGPPQVPLNLVADYGGGGMMLAFGVCAALLERERSGRGQVLDVAMVDGTTVLLAATWEKLAHGNWRDERGVNPLDTGAANYDVYETADGRWMAVGSREPVFHRRLLDTLGLADEPLDVPSLDVEARRARIAARFRQRDQAHWSAVFASVDACVEPVRTLAEAAAADHLAARGTYVDDRGAVEPGAAPRFSRTPGTVHASRGVLGAAEARERWSVGAAPAEPRGPVGYGIR